MGLRPHTTLQGLRPRTRLAGATGYAPEECWNQYSLRSNSVIKLDS